MIQAAAVLFAAFEIRIWMRQMQCEFNLKRTACSRSSRKTVTYKIMNAPGWSCQACRCQLPKAESAARIRVISVPGNECFTAVPAVTCHGHYRKRRCVSEPVRPAIFVGALCIGCFCTLLPKDMPSSKFRVCVTGRRKFAAC